MFTCPIGFFNFIVSSGGGGTTDPYAADVVLFLKGDGTNGSTAITDSSPSPKTISVFGNAQISTAQSKYGGSSLLFDGSGDYLTAPNNESFNFTSRILTIEFWCYIQAASTPNAAGNRNASPLNTYPNSSSVTGWAFYIGGNTTQTGVQLFIESNSSIFKTVIVSVPNQQQNHLGFCQNGDNGYFFLNGTVYPVDCTGFTLGSTSNPLKIGGMNYIGYEHFLNGYLDSVRITKNVCRYTSNFNPETDTYLNSSSETTDPYGNNVVLFLKGDGTNGSTNIVDSSPNPKTISVFGTAQISTAQSKYGGSSLYFDGASWLEITHDAILNFFSGDFTIEAFVRVSNNNPTSLVQKRSTTFNTGDWVFWQDKFDSHSIDSNGSGLLVTSPLTINTFVHTVLQRRGNLYSRYVGGVLVASATYTQTIQNNSEPITIGRDRAGGGRFYLTGYIDSLRITNAARYTANFNPETDTYLNV